MAHDEKISELTGNDAHHEQPASASAPAQMPDVATLRAMMHERQYAAGKALEQQLEADVLHAREVQEELLFEMIEANKDTPFGRDHGFADIKTVEDFKRTVPFTNYDDYAGYIYEVMEHGTRGVVTTEEIVHFNETSGTMGNPKGIPYTKRMAEILMGYSGAYTYYRSYVGAGEGLAGGRMLTLIESHYNTLKSGISFGSLSCKAIADARPYLAATTTSPDEAVFTKPGTDTRYLHARFAIEERDIRDISSVFITGVLDLMRYVEDNWELLVRDIEQGTIDASIQMPADVCAGLEARIEPNPERGFDEPITPAMWPNLLVVRSVAGGGFAPYTQRLRRFIGNDVHILYTGYSASEGAFSVPFQLDDPSSVLLRLLMGFTRLDNAPQLGIVAIVGMSVCDVIFNLVAVCVLDLGLRGMGLATALAYCVTVGICCTHFPSKRNTLHLVNPVPHVGQLAGVLKTGLPDSLTRATVMVRTFTFNWLLLTVASAGAVAALSMLSSVNSFASSVTIGVGQTATLLCGIFFGEEDRGALKATLRTGMRMGLVLSCALCAAVFAFAPQVVGLFGLEGDVRGGRGVLATGGGVVRKPRRGRAAQLPRAAGGGGNGRQRGRARLRQNEAPGHRREAHLEARRHVGAAHARQRRGVQSDGPGPFRCRSLFCRWHSHVAPRHARGGVPEHGGAQQRGGDVARRFPIGELSFSHATWLKQGTKAGCRFAFPAYLPSCVPCSHFRVFK